MKDARRPVPLFSVLTPIACQTQSCTKIRMVSRYGHSICKWKHWLDAFLSFTTPPKCTSSHAIHIYYQENKRPSVSSASCPIDGTCFNGNSILLCRIEMCALDELRFCVSCGAIVARTRWQLSEKSVRAAADTFDWGLVRPVFARAFLLHTIEMVCEMCMLNAMNYFKKNSSSQYGIYCIAPSYTYEAFGPKLTHHIDVRI